MRKTVLAVAMSLSVLSVQAKEINLTCDVDTIIPGEYHSYQISFDNETGKGAIGWSPISADKTTDSYVIYNRDEIWKINRSTLELTHTSTLFKRTTSSKGPCRIVKTNNKI